MCEFFLHYFLNNLLCLGKPSHNPNMTKYYVFTSPKYVIPESALSHKSAITVDLLPGAFGL